MVSQLHDRSAELATLERLWKAPGADLVLVWGRRRVGKSFLLAHFAAGKRAIAYTATERAPELELADFSNKAREALRPGPRDALAGGPFRSWDEALHYLGAAAQRQRLLVALDEFSYLVEGEPSLPSVIQRFWDTVGRSTKLTLVLCGSVTTVLESLADESAPLFGRFTARLQVHPLSYRDAMAFHPALDPSSLARVYGVTGGMPLYLKMWDQGSDVRRNISRLFSDPASPLVNEGELLLRSELPDAAGYFRLMSAVASGRTKYSEIKDAVRIEPARGLDRLIAVRLLERRVPVTGDPERTRVRTYRVADNFLRFWFRYIYPHRGEIDRGLGMNVVDRLIVPHLDDHMGLVFEEMCREFVRARAGHGPDIPSLTKVGSWWTSDGQAEIDVVGLDGKTVVLVGEAKWSRTAGARELASLRGKARRLTSSSPRLALFARERTDVTDESVHTFTVSDLYE